MTTQNEISNRVTSRFTDGGRLSGQINRPTKARRPPRLIGWRFVAQGLLNGGDERLPVQRFVEAHVDPGGSDT